ncbi:MAG: DUF1887 family CARF protein [Flavobacteriaceae bacterium]|nr:DUF1887 family CARF protein [Flavobacteriaceae bacterium]
MFFSSNNDEVLMISTEKMEKQNKNIKEALKNAYNFKNITINPFDVEDIRNKLKDFNFEEYDEKIINITGGTKLMSIEVYSFFSRKFENPKIYYVDKNHFIPILPSLEKQEFKSSVSISDYFKAYGFKINSSQSLVEKKKTYEFFDWFINDKTDSDYAVINDLQKIRNSLKKNAINIDEVEGLKSLLSKIELFDNQDSITKKQIKYLTGDWFEEYVYHKIKEKVDVQEIFCGLEIKSTVGNELDVVFLKDNQLYVIECKTFIKNEVVRGLETNTIYKSDSIKNDLGLFAKSIIVTLNKKREINESHFERAKENNIKFLTLEDFQDDAFIDKLFV